MDAYPRVFCLKSENNNKFLKYKSEDVQTHGVLQFSSQSALDAYTQFQAEKAKCDDGLVHIKCRWNDKYWVRWSRNHQWITGSSWEPNEDKTSWSCTLLKPTIIEEEAGKAKKIRLQHVQLEQYILLKKIDHYPFNDCLLAGSKEIDADSSSPCDVFTVVDWDAIFKIPKHVAIKGDNGMYLGATTMDDKPCLAFSYEDPKDPKVGQQMIHFPDGCAYIKSDYNGKYWRVGEQDYIVVDADEPKGTKKDGSVLFRITPVDVNVIALMNMTRIQFVKIHMEPGKEDSFLCANTQYLEMWAKLEVIDLDN